MMRISLAFTAKCTSCDHVTQPKASLKDKIHIQFTAYFP